MQVEIKTAASHSTILRRAATIRSSEKQSDSEAMERTPSPLAWDPAARSKIRRDAQKANVVIELQRCKVTADYVITYASSPGRKQADPNR